MPEKFLNFLCEYITTKRKIHKKKNFMTNFSAAYSKQFEYFEVSQNADLAAKHNLRLFCDSLYLDYLKECDNEFKYDLNQIYQAKLKTSSSLNFLVENGKTQVEQNEKIIHNCDTDVNKICEDLIAKLSESNRKRTAEIKASYQKYIAEHQVIQQLDSLIESVTKNQLEKQFVEQVQKHEKQNQRWKQLSTMLNEIIIKY